MSFLPSYPEIWNIPHIPGVFDLQYVILWKVDLRHTYEQCIFMTVWNITAYWKLTDGESLVKYRSQDSGKRDNICFLFHHYYHCTK